jgi:hypothetical protein
MIELGATGRQLDRVDVGNHRETEGGDRHECGDGMDAAMHSGGHQRERSHAHIRRGE